MLELEEAWKQICRETFKKIDKNSSSYGNLPESSICFKTTPKKIKENYRVIWKLLRVLNFLNHFKNLICNKNLLELEQTWKQICRERLGKLKKNSTCFGSLPEFSICLKTTSKRLKKCLG